MQTSFYSPCFQVTVIKGVSQQNSLYSFSPELDVDVRHVLKYFASLPRRDYVRYTERKVLRYVKTTLFT